MYYEILFHMLQNIGDFCPKFDLQYMNMYFVKRFRKYNVLRNTNSYIRKYKISLTEN